MLKLDLWVLSPKIDLNQIYILQLLYMGSTVYLIISRFVINDLFIRHCKDIEHL